MSWAGKINAILIHVDNLTYNPNQIQLCHTLWVKSPKNGEIIWIISCPSLPLHPRKNRTKNKRHGKSMSGYW